MTLGHYIALLRLALSCHGRAFLRESKRLLAADPNNRFSSRIALLRGMFRGEKVVRHRGAYVVNSHLPPLPSRAMLTFFGASLDPRRPLTDLAHARRRAPLSTYLCVTNRCGYRCEHCSAVNRVRETELSTAQWQDIVRQLQDLGVCYLGITGGEPLLREGLEEIVAAADDRSTVVMFTSGQTLSRDRARRLADAGLWGMIVSLDSADPARHNQIRGVETAFDTALAAIEHSRAAGLYTIVQPVVYRQDLSRESIERLFRLARRHGAHEVRLCHPIAAGRLLQSREDEKVFHFPEDKELVVRIQHEANRRWFGMPKVSSFHYTEGAEKFGCGAGILHSYITSSGQMTPCDTMELALGNVVTEGVATVYRRMRDAIERPGVGCLANQIAARLAGQTLPLSGDAARRICSECPSRREAAYFAELQAHCQEQPCAALVAHPSG